MYSLSYRRTSYTRFPYSKRLWTQIQLSVFTVRKPSTMDSKLGIEKLTNENYPQWSFEAEMLLEREDLWKHVVDAVPDPVTTAWTAGDRKARATIALLVEKRQHPLIRDAKTARETWNRLKEQHQKTTMCSRVSLICQVCDKKLSEGGDLEAHVYELEELFSRLQGAGKDLGEDVQVTILLRSLPASYESVRCLLSKGKFWTMLGSCKKRKLSLENLHSRWKPRS